MPGATTSRFGCPPGDGGEAGPVEHVLVLRALGLGDLLTAVPALRALRRSRPAATISLAAPQWLAPLVDLIEAVDRLLPTAGLQRLPERAFGADLAVNLHGRGPQSTALLAGSGPRHLLTYAHRAFPDLGGPPWEDTEHEVRRWCRLLEHAGVATDCADLRLRAEPSPWTAGQAPVVLHIGASAPARRWPAPRWAAVAAELAKHGHRVLITGDAGDRRRAEAVRRTANLPPAACLAGSTTLGELVALIAGAALVVVGDTGVAHLASAFATPSVVLFGPMSPALWGPPPGPHRALWAGRTGDPHGRRPDRGLLRIAPDAVVAEVRAVLATG